MDCQRFQTLVAFAGRDERELDTDARAALHTHLGACAACRDWFAKRQAEETSLATAIQDVTIPAQLKGRLKDNLRQAERLARQRRLSRRAVAAALLFTTFFAGRAAYVRSQMRPVDLIEIAQQAEEQFQNPRDEVDRWLAAEGVEFSPEVPFDFALLTAYTYGELQGKRVPSLIFRDPNGRFAKVFVIRSPDFDFSRLPGGAATSTLYGLQVRVLSDAQRPHRLAYVVIFNGDSLEPFRERRPRT